MTNGGRRSRYISIALKLFKELCSASTAALRAELWGQLLAECCVIVVEKFPSFRCTSYRQPHATPIPLIEVSFRAGEHQFGWQDRTGQDDKKTRKTIQYTMHKLAFCFSAFARSQSHLEGLIEAGRSAPCCHPALSWSPSSSRRSKCWNVEHSASRNRT